MYHPQDNLNHNIIIDRFKKGEISISRAFSLLMGSSEELNNKNKIETHISYQKIDRQITEVKENKLEQVLDEMDALIGLNEVKKLVREYLAFLQVQKLRESYQLNSHAIVMHMIFKGNPGTGKTTMARLIGRIFKEVGFLKNGDLLEVERSDLVGEYIGHTAQKTKKLIQKALGGVLFIDEAYSLARGGEKDFGKEAIDTMVKMMEDHKDELIIILAGYCHEMDFFLDTNPGLKSRFALQLDFPDYSVDELVKIAEIMYKQREYILDKESKHFVYRVLTEILNNEGEISGNARTVRNLVEKSIRQQALRIIKANKINRRELIYIRKEDLAWGEGKHE